MSEELSKKYYSIGDVSVLLNLPQSTIRFWEKQFAELQPKRSGGGTRKYTPKDIEQLKIIRFLIKDKCLTIDGAREHLKHNRQDLEQKYDVIRRLKGIRRQLNDILNALDQRHKK